MMPMPFANDLISKDNQKLNTQSLVAHSMNQQSPQMIGSKKITTVRSSAVLMKDSNIKRGATTTKAASSSQVSILTGFNQGSGIYMTTEGKNDVYGQR